MGGFLYSIESVRGDGAIQVVGRTRVDLIEMVVADLPPDLGEVARVPSWLRVLRDRRTFVIDVRELVAPGWALAGLPWAAFAACRPCDPDRAGSWVAVVPVVPKLRVVVLREWLDEELRRVLGIVGDLEAILANEDVPGLLPLVDAPESREHVPEVVVDRRDLVVLRILADEPTVERDRGLETHGHVALGFFAGTLLVESAEAEHRVRGRLLVGVRPL
jgi:hypothetical protein